MSRLFQFLILKAYYEQEHWETIALELVGQPLAQWWENRNPPVILSSAPCFY